MCQTCQCAKFAREMDHGSSIDSTIISTGIRKPRPYFLLAAPSINFMSLLLVARYFWLRLLTLHMQPDPPSAPLEFPLFSVQVSSFDLAQICAGPLPTLPPLLITALHLTFTHRVPPANYLRKADTAPYKGPDSISVRGREKYLLVIFLSFRSVPLPVTTQSKLSIFV
jgi:hypothetical protein